MNAAGQQASKPSSTDEFWDRLGTIEGRLQDAHQRHEASRRQLSALAQEAQRSELREVWSRYCAVVAELDRTSEELDGLSLHSG